MCQSVYQCTYQSAHPTLYEAIYMATHAIDVAIYLDIGVVSDVADITIIVECRVDWGWGRISVFTMASLVSIWFH